MDSLRDIALTAFIFGLLPLVFARPWVGILLWTWVGLMNPHKMTWGFAYNFPFALIIAVVTLIAIVISREPRKLPLTPVVWLLIAFNVWLTITTLLFALYPDLAWEKWEKVVKIQLFIFLTMMMMQSEQRIRLLVLVATLSIAFFGIKGGIYTIAKGGGGMVLGPDGGFIAGNTEIALALVVTLPLMRWLQLQVDRRWLRTVMTVCMVLIAISVLGSYSRGGLLALVAMAVFFWIKSRKKVVLGIVLVILGASFLSFMPDQWTAKMGTIETYEADTSAMGRIGAWGFAWNLAKARPIGGGGYETFQASAYERWAPGASILDPHSIWFQVLAEQGFVGITLFILLWLASWRTGSQIIALSRDRKDLTWARDLAGMIQAALVGFWVGGAFLGLAYWDYPYILVAVLVLTKVVVQRTLEENRVVAPAVVKGGVLGYQTRA